MKHQSFRRMFPVLGAAIALMLAGCVADHAAIDTPAAEGEAAFTVSVPGMQTPSTRALDATKEKQLTAIDVVIFSNTDNKIVEHHRVGTSDIGVGTGSNDYQFRVKGIENTANVTLAVIANAPDEVAAALAAVTVAGTYVGAAKTAFLLALQASAHLKWDTSPGGYRTIPMYGEITVAGNIYDAVTNTVNLTRMLAKVDVVNGVAPENPASPANGTFELTAVHVVNRNTAGLIAPKWNAEGTPETLPATEPNHPAGFVPGMVTWTNGNELTYDLETGQTSLESDIYLFESAALSANPQAPNGLRLVFEGNYTTGGVTKKYYYPVDFTTPAGAYIPVLRNHRYLFTITEANGRGYDGLGEAVAAFGVMSNLRTSLVVVDESGIKNMVWNGEHFLGVNEKEFTVAAAGQSGVELQISTNYADGWKASVEPPANSWLTLGATSGQITDKTLTFSVAPILDEWTIRAGTILLTVGRLETRVNVIQGYRLEIEPGIILMDGTEQKFSVKANFEWKVEFVSAIANVAGFDDQIVAEFNEQSGGTNTTTGDPVTFTCNDYIYNWDPDFPTKATVTVKISRLDPVAGWVEWDIFDIICYGAFQVGESNCYMIDNNNPIPILIPISQIHYAMKGNVGAGSGFLGSTWLQPADYSKLKAAVLWSDVDKFNGEDDAVVKIVTYNGGLTLGDGKIVVIPGKGIGNTGIILYVDNSQPANDTYDDVDVIKWSWHIWNSPYFPYATGTYPSDEPIVSPGTTSNIWLDRNLGATSATPGNIQTVGLTYQWGRKDPYPGASAWGNSSATFYYPSGSPASLNESTAPAQINFTNSVQNPLTRYIRGVIPFDWFTNSTNASYQNHNLWGGANSTDGFLHSGGKKSVYDPCPEGYRVPKNGENGWGSDTSWPATAYYGRTHPSYGGYYPLAGYRPSDEGGITNAASLGRYWQATAYPSNVYGYSLYLPNGSSAVNPNENGRRALGFSVRCRAE